MNATDVPDPENVPAIVGLGTAADLAKQEQAAYAEHLGRLTHRLREGLDAYIDRLHYNGHPDHCAPGTLNVSFESVEGESLILRLDMEGICVSTGFCVYFWFYGTLACPWLRSAYRRGWRKALSVFRLVETQPKPKLMPLLPNYRRSSNRCVPFIEGSNHLPRAVRFSP